MKTRRFLALFLAMAMLLVLVAGCSANVPNSNKAPVSDSGNLSGSLDENYSQSAVAANRKLIRRIYLDAETEDMDALLAKVSSRVSALGGYIEERNIYNGSSSGSQNRSATLTIRIPADKLDSFVTEVEGISNIIRNTESTDDVTLQYSDIESRLRVLRAEEERLLAFMSQAKTVSEMLQIETRLTDVLSEIDKLTSQQKLYDNLVDYGTVTLSIDEVEEYTETTRPGFWQRLGEGFLSSLKNVGAILQGLFIFFVCSIPYLLPLAIAGSIVLLIIHLCRKKRKQKAE